MVCTTPEKIPGYSFSLHVHVLYSLPKYMFLDLPRDVIRSVARLRLRVHTLRFETATWSPRSDDCWSPHIVSAMTGLIQEYMFKDKLRNCEPIDLSRFIVDLRGRHLELDTPL